MTKEILKKLCTSLAVSGNESSINDTVIQESSRYGKTYVDPNNNVITEIFKQGSANFSLTLDAHLDQIGFMVTHIFEDGFLKIASCGGSDPLILIGSCVIIYGKENIIGTVCSIPPHVSKFENRENLSIEDLFIDVGPESIKLISVGNIVSFVPKFRELLNNRISSTALDNRAGVAALLRVLEFIKSGVHPKNLSLYTVFSSQEETTGKGAYTSTYSLNPTHSIVVDVTFATQPDTYKHATCPISHGPMIGISPILNKDMTNDLIKLAKQNNIPYGIETMSSKTGTNADKISLSRHGVNTALISIPIRYMHSNSELVDLDDIENTARLIVCYINHLGGLN